MLRGNSGPLFYREWKLLIYELYLKLYLGNLKQQNDKVPVDGSL